LQSELMRAKATDFSEAPSDSIGIGSIVKLKDTGSGEQICYTILGAWDGDPDNNVLSYLTPLGQSILGKKVGDDIQIDVEGNSQSLIVESVSRWVDNK
jgi:transcription elongation GreA/GreB family factor